MPDYEPPHALRSGSAEVSPLSMIRALAGLILLLLGTGLGLYLAYVAFQIVGGNEPPGLVARFANQLADGLPPAGEPIPPVGGGAAAGPKGADAAGQPAEENKADAKAPAAAPPALPAQPAARGNAGLQISPELRKLALYFLVVLLLYIPGAVAKSLIATGATLLSSDAREAIQQLADRLRNASGESTSR